MAQTNSSSQTTASLVVRRGARQGKKYALKGGPFQIGREARCDLVLKDSYVSPVHTVIEMRGDLWVASNRGANGTLINEKPIEGSRTLAPGDVIQVGAETLLEFRIQKVATRSSEPGGPVPLWRRTPVVVGLGVYLAAMVALIVFLGARPDGPQITSQTRQQVLEDSREFLVGATLGGGSAELAGGLDPQRDAATVFYQLAAARSRGAGSDQTETLVDELLEATDALLFQAWLAEQSGNRAQAVRAYRKIVDMLPTMRCPATSFALARIRALGG